MIYRLIFSSDHLHPTRLIVSNARMEHVGRSFERVEDPALLRGAGRFADDLAEPPGCLHAAFLRAPVAHAEIKSIDTKNALALPGVTAIITGSELAQHTAPFLSGVKVNAPQYALAIERVRHVGEPVAIVVARDRYVAEDALEIIQVDYASLDPVVDPEVAAEPTTQLLHPDAGSNVLHERRFKYGDPDQAFAEAAHVVKTTVRYPRNSCTPIEAFVVLATYHPGENVFEVTANFQGPYTLHPVMARALGLPGNRLRLKTPPDSGGSFGTKQAVFNNIVGLAVAAKVSRRPVKWVEDRLEHLAASTSATNRVTTIQAALDADGHITALDYDQLEDCGAYLRAPEPATIYRMHGNMTGAYTIENLAIRNRVVVTNKTPTGLMRGFGGPQVYFALERVVDLAAARLGIDPLEIRRRNLVPPNAMPHSTAPGAVLDSGNYLGTVDRAEHEGDLAELRARRAQARADGRLYGIGHACIIEPSISNMGYITTLLTPQERARSGAKNGALATASVNFDPSGAVTVQVSSVPQGQGHRTVLAQVVADELGIYPSTIVTATDHDTLKDPWSIASGNYSSRFAGAVAGAAKLAAARIAERLKSIAASDLNVPLSDVELTDGMARAVSNPDNAIPIERIAAKAHWSPLSVPLDAGAGLRETAFWTAPELSEPDTHDRVNSSGAYGFIFDFCGVEVDPLDGAVRIDKYVTAHDAGRILNPTLADGQIRGGFAHGFGAALLEELTYTPDGAFLAGTFSDYCPPYASDMPELKILHDQSPSPVTPTGAKGLGEGNCMSTPVCIANAVADAVGCPVNTLPLTRERILKLISIEEPVDPKPTRIPPLELLGDGHALRGEGSATVPASPEKVWETILDPDHLPAIIPFCHAVEHDGEHTYRVEASFGIGPIRGRFQAQLLLSNLDPGKGLCLNGDATGALGCATGRSEIRLTKCEKGTRVDYAYALLISGKIASVGGRLLEGAVRGQIAEIFGRIAGANTTKTASGLRARLAGWLRVKS
ncbi:MAG: carbon monoxide dehydrogenase [Rhodospirillaceae bacterium]|nr:carbon monoxide dehydrogenase [Rhodospirillaceae bacterium]